MTNLEIPLRVLHLEDDPRDADLVRTALAVEEVLCDVEYATNREEYAAALARGRFDLILSDHGLPAFDGREALEIAQAWAPYTPFILVSGTVGEEAAIESMRRGATDYVLKHRLNRLGPAVRRALEEAENRRVQSVAYRLAEAAAATESLADLFPIIHRIIGDLMPAKNLYVALYDAAADRITFPYSVDEVDRVRTPRAPARGLTEFVLRTGQGALVTAEHRHELERAGEVVAHGAPAVDWLGVPLVAEGQTFGVLAVQSYTATQRYSDRDRHLLTLASSPVAMAIRRRQAEDALRESVEKFRLLTENIQEIFFIADSSTGRATYVSPAFETIHGRSRESAYAAPYSWMAAVHPEDKERLLEEARGAQSTARDSVTEFRIVRPDGAVRWLRTRVFPIGDESGHVHSLVGVSEDITDLRQVEAQLRQSQKMETVGRLAGGIAHDFNNLLTVILNCAAFAKEALPADNPARDDIGEIEQAGTLAATLTRQLLAFARRQVAEPRAVNVNTVIAAMDKMLRRLIGEDIDLVSLPSPDLGTVWMDPAHIEQLVVNLAVNARDAMPGGGRLTVETSNATLDADFAARHAATVEPGDYVVLAVSDTGHGMSPETMEHVFEPFFTTKEAGKGTGLGLATCYGIVKQSGGWIWVYSEPGRGASFKAYFPRHHAAAAPVARPPDGPLPGGTEPILLVEDEPKIRELTSRMLRARGYQVIEAAGAEQALRLASTQPTVTLLITDLVMPGMSGNALAQRLRAEHPRLRVLFMSGYAESAIVRHGVLAPGSAFLPKPFTAANLARRVRDVLDTPIRPK